MLDKTFGVQFIFAAGFYNSEMCPRVVKKAKIEPSPIGSFFPEDFVEGLAKHLADASAQVYGGIVITFFYCIYSLARYADFICQILLG